MSEYNIFESLIFVQTDVEGRKAERVVKNHF